MKKYLIGIILFAFSANLGFGQPIFNSTDFTIDLNAKSVMKGAHNYDLISSGANITWDFSSLDTSVFKADTIGFVTRDEVCDGSLSTIGAFSNSNVFVKEGNLFSLYANTNDGLFFEGSTNCTYVTLYTNMLTTMQFPFSYGSSFTDFYRAYISSFPYPFNNYEGSVEVTADGYGTLILPNLVLNNVLKLHVFKTGYNTPMNIVDTSYQELWYSRGIAHPVLQITNNSHAKYLDHIVNAIEKPNKLVNNIIVYPIPASESIYVSIAELNTKSSYVIVDLLGKQVDEGTINESISTIDIRGLAPGVYFLNIEIDGDQSVNKIVVSQ